MEGHNMPNTTAATAATATNLSKQTPPGLLRLPPHVRERIYRQLDMTEWEGSPRSFDLHGHTDPYGPPPSSFRGLLLCCRTIYTEAAALVYSVNRFFIHYSDPGSLKPLHALTPTSLAFLARLKVVLNQASCHARSESTNGRWCCHDWVLGWEVYVPSGGVRCTSMLYHSGQHRHPLASCAPFDYGDGWQTAQTVLDEWEEAAAYISPHISAGQLRLSLVCDIDHEQKDSIDIGKRVVAPLRSLPQLKDCSVRLCATPTQRLWRLAQDAALQARRVANPYYHPSPTLTTLTTLPRELRLRILEYTDLITPYREVGWSRASPAYFVYDKPCSTSDYGSCFFPNHHGCQFFRCWMEGPFPSDGCFCRRRHSASSSECRCWTAPGSALFLVCRALCQDAQLVFFSGNRFIVGDMDLGYDIPLPTEPCVWLGARNTQAVGSYSYHRFAVSQFLKEIVPVHCLAYIRFLELVFPPYCHSAWPRPEHPAMKDWCATVDWLNDKINGPKLTLRLIMTDVDGRMRQSDRTRLTELEGKAIVRAYMNISSPLRHLTSGDTGLAMFHAEFAYPWAWTDVTRAWLDRHQFGHGYLEVPQRELEEFAERYVMGDRYKEVDDPDNRELPERSMWQFWGPLDY